MTTKIPLPLAQSRRAYERMVQRKIDAYEDNADCLLLDEMDKAIGILFALSKSRYYTWQDLGGTSDIHSRTAVKWTEIAMSTPDTMFNLDWDSIEYKQP